MAYGNSNPESKGMGYAMPGKGKPKAMKKSKTGEISGYMGKKPSDQGEKVGNGAKTLKY